MTAQLVSRTYLTIDGDTITCDSIDESVDPAVKTVDAMTRDNRHLGHAQGVPNFPLSAVVPMDAGDTTHDFEQMALDMTEFSAGIEYEGGGSKTYTECVITKVDIKSKTGDHVHYSLSISARDFVKN
jgi:hypothetical protein